MKLQSLAIMFIVLILPISIVLSSYTQTRVQTLNLQAEYDSKLNDATYDALKAYQINSLTSSSGDFTNSKIRDIKASVNTFFNSMSVNFYTAGYSKTTLQNYVPALVYTMYDGYYIYSPYTNKWDDETKAKYEGEEDKLSYHYDEKLFGLKPYVYYSCRYKSSTYDIVITYSLDNYIQIEGIINNNQPVNKSGYLLSNIEKVGDNYKYNEIEISSSETLFEYVIYANDNGNEASGTYRYIKKNGMKYYLDSNNNEVFYVLNGKRMRQSGIFANDIINNSSAKKYYEDAYNLRKFIEENLSDLSTEDILDENGKKYENNNNPYYSVGKIFDFSYTDGIESSTSNFNTHRIDVIKHSIERNLAIVINNFNNYSGATTDFQMPKLKDSDWDKIMDNISIISFLQGINIGGKVYNGYSIITNTKNEDVVMEDSIYIITNNDTIAHRVTENGLTGVNSYGVFNVNLERRTEEISAITKYYFPVNVTLSYDSIVTQNNVTNLSNSSLKKYLKDSRQATLAKIYYTALGRERYGLYRQKLEIDTGSY